ncbi:hypothetical protein [Nocardioides pocheonensis]|uniref:Lipoprotein n=1 Tax=Nocardioides pocheonensis TaxID=661485 RepID=A0A3N0GF99_9ACTN|nr:hypothetical protein [Nocardioides pocheonensis]RNM11144.1 hypothetical protein EFL26_23670 [Nocardioides pocheonensis]
MAERLGARPRPTGMPVRVLGTLLVLPLLLAACGDVGGSGAGSSASPSASTWACRASATPVSVTRADLDGDGSLDEVSFTPASGNCPASLDSSVQGLRAGLVLDWDLAPAGAPATAVRVPGRSGDLVLLLEEHPRGGFQAHLYGFAEGRLGELTVHDQPVFPFVATDVLSHPIAATCVDGGFEVTEGRAHEPIGVVPAWDVFRTTYRVDGNAVTKGVTTEVADNVLDRDFRVTYPELVRNALFENCRVGPQ